MCSYRDYVLNVEVEIDEIINARYVLVADLNQNNTSSCAIIMKNPSKANKEISDKTVNNVLEVAYNHGFSKVYILNLYSYYSPKVKDIKDLILANTSEHLNRNNKVIADTMIHVNEVIVAWGTIQGSAELMKNYNNRIKTIYNFIKNKKILVLDEDFTHSRFPKHPQTLALNSSNITLKNWYPDNI